MNTSMKEDGVSNDPEPCLCHTYTYFLLTHTRKTVRSTGGKINLSGFVTLHKEVEKMQMHKQR
jgi:hypothetical protein